MQCPELKDLLKDHAPDRLKADHGFMVLALERDEDVWDVMGDRLKNSTEFIEEAVQKQPRVLLLVPAEKQKKPEMVKLYLDNMLHLMDTYAADLTESWCCAESMEEALTEHKSVRLMFAKVGFFLDPDEMPDCFLNEKDVMLEMVKNCECLYWRTRIYDYAQTEEKSVLNDPDWVAEAAKYDGNILLFVSEEFIRYNKNGMEMIWNALQGSDARLTAKLCKRFPVQTRVLKRQLAEHKKFNKVYQYHLLELPGRPMLDLSVLSNVSDFLAKPEDLGGLQQLKANLTQEKKRRAEITKCASDLFAVHENKRSRTQSS